MSSQPKPRYKIIGKYIYAGNSRIEFEGEVSEALEQGYELHGNLIVHPYADGTDYYQAVYLPRDEATNG